MKGPARKLPRVVSLNYAIRTGAFAYCFLVMGLLFWERQMSVAAWGMLALQFLVYPHLVWLRARLSRDPRRAELQNLNLDSVLIDPSTVAERGRSASPAGSLGVW